MPEKRFEVNVSMNIKDGTKLTQQERDIAVGKFIELISAQMTVSAIYTYADATSTNITCVHYGWVEDDDPPPPAAVDAPETPEIF
jgi:hypothetical protein